MASIQRDDKNVGVRIIQKKLQNRLPDLVTDSQGIYLLPIPLVNKKMKGQIRFKDFKTVPKAKKGDILDLKDDDTPMGTILQAIASKLKKTTVSLEGGKQKEYKVAVTQEEDLDIDTLAHKIPLIKKQLDSLKAAKKIHQEVKKDSEYFEKLEEDDFRTGLKKMLSEYRKKISLEE